jgi:hypothetical protein
MMMMMMMMMLTAQMISLSFSPHLRRLAVDEHTKTVSRFQMMATVLSLS